MITEEMKAKAQHYDGTVPENWELLGIVKYRDTQYRRFYVTPSGEYRFTVQPLKKRREPKIDVREAAGYTFASRRWKRRTYEVW